MRETGIAWFIIMGDIVAMPVRMSEITSRRVKTMKTDKLARLQASGWKVGSAEDFLQLSDEEAQLIASGATTRDIQAAFTAKE